MGEFKSAFDIEDDDPETQAPVPGDIPEDQPQRKRGRPPGSKRKKPESRDDTVHIGGNFRMQVSTELQRVCVERQEATGQKCTIQALLAEGINYVLRKYGHQPIANEDIRI